MDFARKQLEKYGWKEGEGLGKAGNEGIKTAIKPHYKTGKAGMGFDLAKDLTDRWWTRAYDASLKAVDVVSDAKTGNTIVKGAKADGSSSSDSPINQIHKRMMKANFTEFSKGGTLAEGKLVKSAHDDSDSSSDDDGPSAAKVSHLTDEQLFLACGGRTAHKGARHGLKLSGKLARLAAQDAYLEANPEKMLPKHKRKKAKKAKLDKEKSEENTE